MNLISCGGCGTVLDKDKIYKPHKYKASSDGEGEEVDEKNAAWDGDSWATTIYCPACESRIFYSNGDEVY